MAIWFDLTICYDTRIIVINYYLPKLYVNKVVNNNCIKYVFLKYSYLSLQMNPNPNISRNEVVAILCDDSNNGDDSIYATPEDYLEAENIIDNIDNDLNTMQFHEKIK